MIHTPHEKAIKFWIGGVGQTSQMAVVFAQLITQGQSKGVHLFVVQLRDRQTHKPMPGVRLGDCGHKIGCDGIDNGWIMFDHYKIPRENLLNKYADV